MNKIEFLQGLQSALSGNVPPETVRENLRYYSDYIRAEVQKGRSERDVMEELGDPRLIARTIMDATPGAGEGMFEEYRSFIPFGSSSADSGYAGETRNEGEPQAQGGIFTGNSSVHYYDLNKWYWKLAAVLVAVLVVTLIITVVGGILSILIPILPIIFLVMIVMWFVRGR